MMNRDFYRLLRHYGHSKNYAYEIASKSAEQVNQEWTETVEEMQRQDCLMKETFLEAWVQSDEEVISAVRKWAIEWSLIQS